MVLFLLGWAAFGVRRLRRAAQGARDVGEGLDCVLRGQEAARRLWPWVDKSEVKLLLRKENNGILRVEIATVLVKQDLRDENGICCEDGNAARLPTQ